MLNRSRIRAIAFLKRKTKGVRVSNMKSVLSEKPAKLIIKEFRHQCSCIAESQCGNRRVGLILYSVYVSDSLLAWSDSQFLHKVSQVEKKFPNISVDDLICVYAQIIKYLQNDDFRNAFLRFRLINF